MEAKEDAWYSLIFLVKGSHYVIELVSTIKPTGVQSMPQMEQRMSEAHCDKFTPYQSHPAHVLLISSINRATSNMAQIEDVYSNLFHAKTTHQFDGQSVVRRCYSFDTSSTLAFPPGPGAQALDEDVCFTARASDATKDKILSVEGFEEMLWAVHAATIGNNANSMIDKYTDNHYALPLPSAGLSALSTNFTSDDPYPITKDTRLAYACKQNYIIDPTGWSIQPIGQASWPKCSGAIVV